MKHCDKHPQETFHQRCPACNREYQKKWFDANKQTQRNRVKSNTNRYIKRNRLFILNYLETHPCVVCGETDPIVLQFDHIDSSDKISNISDLIRSCSSLDKLAAEISKCQVLCANDHQRKTSQQFNWYRNLD